MTTFGKILRAGAAAALPLVGLTAGAQGQGAPGGAGSSFGGAVRGATYLRGKVICTGCTLDEVQKAQPTEHMFYQFTYQQGQLVMQVREVNNSRWSYLSWPPQLWVRANDSVFQQLTAEENLMKEIEITGLLNNSRTLDIFVISLQG